MSKKIFTSDIFIEIDKDNGQENLRYLKSSTTYRKFVDHWLLESSLHGVPDFIISFEQAVLYFDEAGATAYNQTTLEAFLDLSAKGGASEGEVFTDVTGEPSGALAIGGNIVRISQANYDAAETATTLIANTIYVIDQSL